MLQIPELSGQYQLVVTRDSHLDEIEVKCEIGAAGGDAHALGRHLQERIKTLCGVTTKVSVGAPESIERTLVGKARRVVDLRKK